MWVIRRSWAVDFQPRIKRGWRRANPFARNANRGGLAEAKNNLENQFDAPVLMLKDPARTT
jgi:hypothetical protein